MGSVECEKLEWCLHPRRVSVHPHTNEIMAVAAKPLMCLYSGDAKRVGFVYVYRYLYNVQVKRLSE